MPEGTKKLYELERATELALSSLIYGELVDETSADGYSTRGIPVELLASAILKKFEFADLETARKTIIDAINEVRPKFYNYIGQIINAEGVDVKGFGVANITLAGGIARIDFTCKLETVTSSTVTNWGINRDFFKLSIGGIEIIPEIGGSLIYIGSNGTLKSAETDFGGMGNPEGSRWKIGRIYKNSSNQYVRGSWGTSHFAAGDVIQGTLYGRY